MAQQRNRRYNEETSGNFRTEKYNSQNWTHWMDSIVRDVNNIRLSELKDQSIEIIQSEQQK